MALSARQIVKKTSIQRMSYEKMSTGQKLEKTSSIIERKKMIFPIWNHVPPLNIAQVYTNRSEICRDIQNCFWLKPKSSSIWKKLENPFLLKPPISVLLWIFYIMQIDVFRSYLNIRMSCFMWKGFKSPKVKKTKKSIWWKFCFPNFWIFPA